MTGKLLISLLTTIILLTPVPYAQAQQPTKTPRIGILRTESPPATASVSLTAFRAGMRDLDYVEGQNVSFEYRWAEGRYERLPDLAAELVRLKVDVILSEATPATEAARQATTTIPVVFVLVSDPVASGFVTSLTHPGGTITGLTNISSDLSGKQLELLKESVPDATRVAVLLNSSNPSIPLLRRETEAAARLLQVQLHLHDARDPKDLDSSFIAMRRERASAVLVLAQPITFQRRIADLAIQGRLPSIYWARGFTDLGGLMCYGPNPTDLHRRAATYVDKILKGAKPGDLPVEQPTKFEFVINLKTAKQIGLTIPPNVLARADRVIK